MLNACGEPAVVAVGPFDALYGDCATVIDGPVCMLKDDGRLRLSWPAGQKRAIEQRVAGRWLGIEATRAPQDPASLRRLQLHSDADRLALITAGGQRSELALGRETLPVQLQRVRDAMRASDADLQALAAELETLTQDTDFDRPGSARGLLGRLYFRLDLTDDAIAAYEQAVVANQEQGRRLEALRNTNTLSYLLIARKADHEEIARRYAQLSLSQPVPAEALYFEDYFVGIAAQESGESRVALLRLARAGDLARRMAWARRSLDSDQALALHLMQIGRFDDAASLLDAWSERGLPDELSRCERANFLSNRAWLSLLQHEATGVAHDAAGLLARARPDVDSHCRLAQRVNLRINQAFAQLLSNDFAGARDALNEARALTESPDRRLQLWALDIDARINVAQGDLARANASLSELDTLARVTRSPDARWRAAVGRARLAQIKGDLDLAITRYRDADTQLTNDLIRLPLDAGRDGLVASRRQSRQAHFELLVERGQIDAAYDLVLRSHTDVLALLQSTAAADDADALASLRTYRVRRAQLQEAMSTSWTLPQDEKDRLLARSDAIERDLSALVDKALTRPADVRPKRAPLAEREVELGFFLVRDQWLGFVRDNDTVRMAATRCDIDDAALVACLLRPVADDVRAARKLRVLPTGSLWALDFHAEARGLRDDGDVLSVTYALALPPAAAADRGGRALIVADTGGDLPSAREEQFVVGDAVAGMTWQVDTLDGRAALSTALLDRLGNVDLFHFAGHARVAGPRGWRSELALGADTSLSVFDILALPAVPSRVVLSGCETAGTRGSAAATIGLAQAFVLRGGQSVIAAVREVDDATTLAVMRVFYAQWAGGQDMARALALAQQQVSEVTPDADWSAFRIIER